MTLYNSIFSNSGTIFWNLKLGPWPIKIVCKKEGASNSEINSWSFQTNFMKNCRVDIRSERCTPHNEVIVSHVSCPSLKFYFSRNNTPRGTRRNLWGWKWSRMNLRFQKLQFLQPPLDVIIKGQSSWPSVINCHFITDGFKTVQSLFLRSLTITSVLTTHLSSTI